MEANEADAVSVFLVADKTGRPQWGPGVWWCGGLRPSESCVLPSSEKQSASLAVLQMCFDERTERTLRPSFRRDYSSKFCNHGARNTKELRNTVLLLIPFEETDSIKRSVKSRSLFVVQISFFCFLFKYRTIHFQRPSPSASMTNSLKKKKQKPIFNFADRVRPTEVLPVDEGYTCLPVAQISPGRPVKVYLWVREDYMDKN